MEGSCLSKMYTIISSCSEWSLSFKLLRPFIFEVQTKTFHQEWLTYQKSNWTPSSCKHRTPFHFKECHQKTPQHDVVSGDVKVFFDTHHLRVILSGSNYTAIVSNNRNESITNHCVTFRILWRSQPSCVNNSQDNVVTVMGSCDIILWIFYLFIWSPSRQFH